MVNFRCVRAALAVSLLCVGQSNGAEAAFSKDGKKVFLVANNYSGPRDAKLLVVQLDSGRVTDLQFSNIVKEADSQLVAIARDGQGRLACLTKSGLWTIDPDTGTAAAVAEVPRVPPSQQNVDHFGSAPDQAERAYEDLAVFPPADQTLITSSTWTSDYSRENYWLLSGKKKLSSLRIRRHEMEAPAFASNGDIFYAGDGDLWHGRIDHEEESVDGGQAVISYSVNAYRYAPLATFETGNYTAGEIAVKNVAVSAKMLYAQVTRGSGSGWGHIVRLAKPAPIKNTEGSVSPFSLRKFYPMYAKALQSVQILGDSMRSPSYLCASEDGRRVFFVTRDNNDKDTSGRVRAWLATDDSSPHEISLPPATRDLIQSSY